MKWPLKVNEITKQFIEINTKINDLYEKRRKLVELTLQSDLDPTSFDAAPLIIENEDSTWTRVTITDNSERINDGFYVFTKVEKFQVDVKVLKNKPKELK